MSVHLVVPFRIDGDSARTVPDGSLDEVIQNVEVIIRSRRGERLVQPDFGLSDNTFDFAESAPDIAEIESAARQWEPRALLDISERVIDEGEVSISVAVSMEEVA